MSGFGAGRFAPLPQRLAELSAPVIPQGTTPNGDVVVYALSLTEEALGQELLINLAAAPGVVVVGVDRGFSGPGDAS